jgi:hypothetical protein
MKIETNIDYPVPAETCHVALRDDVLNNFSVMCWIGYSLISFPYGSCRLKIEEEDSRAYLIKVRTRFWTGGVIPETVGPLLNIYSIATAETRCSVQMVAKSTSYYSSQLANFYLDAVNAVFPIYKFRISPKIFFDNEVVYDHKSFNKTRASQDINVRAYKYIFAKLHKQLDRFLQQLYLSRIAKLASK